MDWLNSMFPPVAGSVNAPADGRDPVDCGAHVRPSQPLMAGATRMIGLFQQVLLVDKLEQPHQVAFARARGGLELVARAPPVVAV
jgi:hypothetical protein